MRLTLLLPLMSLVAALAGCSIEADVPDASRFRVSWQLEEGSGATVACEAVGAERVVIRSARDVTQFRDEMVCADGAGETLPLPGGTYSISAVAVDADDVELGESMAQFAVLRDAQHELTLELFTIEVSPSP